MVKHGLKPYAAGRIKYRNIGFVNVLKVKWYKDSVIFIVRVMVKR